MRVARYFPIIIVTGLVYQATTPLAASASESAAIDVTGQSPEPQMNGRTSVLTKRPLSTHWLSTLFGIPASLHACGSQGRLIRLWSDDSTTASELFR